MPRMRIFNSAEQKAFENPPIFSSGDRKKFFNISTGIEEIVDTLRTPTNKVCFIVMLGYFRATGRFFIRRFHPKDIEFVAKRLAFKFHQIKVGFYNKFLYHRHKKIILEYHGIREFGELEKQTIAREIQSTIRSQLRPKLILLRMLEILASNKIEIPTYNILANLIVEGQKEHKLKLSNVIEESLTEKSRKILDTLLEKEDQDDVQLEKQRYKLTLLKKFNQSTKPKKVKANIEDLLTLKKLFYSLEHTFESLNLSYDGIKYYALSVIRSEIFQVSRRSNESRYLHLVAFVVHQFFSLQDLLIDSFLSSVLSNTNSAKREDKEQYYDMRKKSNKPLLKIFDDFDQGYLTFSMIEQVVKDPGLSNDEKVERIDSLLTENKKRRIEAKIRVDAYKKETENINKDTTYYDHLEAKSVKLQNRVSEIVKHIEFAKETSAPLLMEAVKYFKEKDGNINKNAPSKFLSVDEEDLIFDEQGKFRISLYKSLLFRHLSEAIKAGTINLRYSYKYRPLDEYMISKAKWRDKLKEFLKRADLTAFSSFKAVLEELERLVDEAYRRTNQNIINGKNENVKFRKDGTFILHTPKGEDDEIEHLSELFPQKEYISLLEILNTINNASGFLDTFEHWQVKYNRPKPSEKTFLAGIMGYGCNIGTNKIAKISKKINDRELENTVNWYFSENNVSSANDRILSLMDSLNLPNIYRSNRNLLHTSSDGQKLGVAVDSLNAGYSFKYHGMEKGSSAYRFIDERHFLFDSIVFSSSEKEAPYVIDGLMHNDVVKSDIHSTDTDGYTDAIFGVCYLLGFVFAPRIKGISKKLIYSFKKRKSYEELDYLILPDKYINVPLIEENWDDILRFVATIKLKETSASQLFKRLNSYSKQHVLYQALKEFGKIAKTLFILRYIDDVEFRQAIEKQLNKIENSHKFANAVSFDDSDFLYGTKEEQEISEGCRRLIENAIICWNYLYLSQKISNEKNDERKQTILDAIKNGSIMTWKHINLHGEYDFSDERLHDSVGLKIPKILELKVV